MKSWALHAHVRFLLIRNQSTLTNHLPSVDLFIPPPSLSSEISPMALMLHSRWGTNETVESCELQI